MDLLPHEIRVLGCLIEKQRTTPDAYPLTLNALRAACNQSTNRDPVVDYDEATVRDGAQRLSRRRWARLASGAGSRAPKYRHLLDEALTPASDELAVLCVLMLRGPQTPGELKQRTERMYPFDGLGALHETLARLIDRELVLELARRPGQKEERYAQLLSERDDDEPGPPVSVDHAQPRPAGSPGYPGRGSFAAPVAPAAHSTGPGPGLAERVTRLEAQIAVLRSELESLRARFAGGGDDGA